MIGVICILFPAIVLCVVRNSMADTQNKGTTGLIIEYLLAALGLNLVLMLVVTVLLHNKQNLFSNLNLYNDFAIKYILLSMTFAVIEPFVERYIRNNVSWDFKVTRRNFEFKHFGLITALFAAVLAGLNFIRIFDNNLWGDEAFTARIVNFSFAQMISATTSDVHPPLYYIIVQALYRIFEVSGVLYHFASLIPYILIVLIALTYVWKNTEKRRLLY